MRILVVEDDWSTRLAVKSQLENPGTEIPVGGGSHVVTEATTQSEAEDALRKQSFDYIFLDLKLGSDRFAGKDILREIIRNYPTTVCIMMSSNGADEALEDCLKMGAAEYIIKPFEFRIVHDIMRKARIVHRLFRQTRYLRTQAGSESTLEPLWITTKSKEFQAVIDDAKKLRRKNNIAIFLKGESGVGKGAFARFLWTMEEDETRPFVSVHTGSIPSNLIESELFGHKKGAFTGANEAKIGKFESANGGDIFLDEVGTMQADMQVKLLQVINDRQVTPLGSSGTAPKPIDIRVISATNADLPQMIKAKEFREDLFFRLTMITLTIPPLRKRKEDIPDLIEYFIKNSSQPQRHLSQAALDFCIQYEWPGNIRQLENTIRVALAISDNDEIDLDTFKKHIKSNEYSSSSSSEIMQAAKANGADAGPYGLDEDQIAGQYEPLTAKFELDLINYAYEKTGSVLKASEFLGMNRNTLTSKLRRQGIAIK